MMTLRKITNSHATLPTATAWLIGDLGVLLGRQQLFLRQSPQRLRVLREHALIESAVSSNRIEGVEVDNKRIATLVFGAPTPRDRDEAELRGYRSALDLIHHERANLPVAMDTLLKLHRLARGDIWDAGKLKEKTEPIIERYPDGRSRIRFIPTEAGAPTQAGLDELFALWNTARRDARVNGLTLLAGFVLDFLCIHPFRDGNGRASRLLTLLLSYHAGVEVGRYISLERLIEQNKDRYYETLEQSSRGWHEAKHDPWPFINYLLWIFKQAYAEFENRSAKTQEPYGAKAQLVRDAVASQQGGFGIADLERACPGVGRDWIRQILRKMKSDGELRTTGNGSGAQWHRVE
jgi:Fic family protein